MASQTIAHIPPEGWEKKPGIGDVPPPVSQLSDNAQTLLAAWHFVEVASQHPRVAKDKLCAAMVKFFSYTENEFESAFSEMLEWDIAKKTN